MNIAVTGANGFIAKNFIYNFINSENYKLHKITRKTSKNKIINILKKSEIIYHFAGVNRPTKSKTFKKDNIELTKFICEYLQKNKLKKTIVFSSSTQVNKNNDYGKSKKICENLLIKFSKKNKSKVFILRLPNIFGKWSKPNYNSVISTFCHNISRNKNIMITDPSEKVNLFYIDDLVKILKKFKDNKIKNNIIYYKIKGSKIITLKKLSEIIIDFERKRRNFCLGDISSKFKKNLYSTYVSFLPRSKVTYKLKPIKDSRGSFTEFLKTNKNGQFSIFVANKNQIRGHHFHHSKVEKFLVLKGKAKFSMWDISSNHKINLNLNGKNPTVVESIPGWQHYIKNVGLDELVVLLWSNEIFDVNKPDTFRL